MHLSSGPAGSNFLFRPLPQCPATHASVPSDLRSSCRRAEGRRHSRSRCGCTAVEERPCAVSDLQRLGRSEEHTSELQSLMRISYAVFCLKKKKHNTQHTTTYTYSE